MEEGGGKSESEIAARFAAWEKRGRRTFEDLRAFCQETGHADLQPWASTNAPRQKTWCGLIKEKGSRENKPDLIRDPVTYQRTEWLTEGGDTCLINLMPLPSPGIDTWNYAAWSNLPALLTRKMYIATFVDTRINLIREAIRTHRPEHVIFVGLTNAPYWNRIAEGMVNSDFDIMEHPASRSRRSTFVTPTIGVLRFMETPIPPVQTTKENEMSVINERSYLNIMHEWVKLTYPNELRKARSTIGIGTDDSYQCIGQKNKFDVYLSFVDEPNRSLCLEYKMSGRTDRRQIEARLDEIRPNLDHRIKWQPNGKDRGRVTSPIISLYYSERPDAYRSQSEEEWFKHWYILFLRIVEQVT